MLRQSCTFHFDGTAFEEDILKSVFVDFFPWNSLNAIGSYVSNSSIALSFCQILLRQLIQIQLAEVFDLFKFILLAASNGLFPFLFQISHLFFFVHEIK